MPPPTIESSLFIPNTPRAVIKHVSRLDGHWDALARDDQRPPAGEWLIWLLLGGRGSGKTRAGAEWVRASIRKGARRIALVAPSYNAAREVMLEGESGLLSLGCTAERPVYLSSRRRLEWPNGAVGLVFSSEDPDSLRGPQFDAAWADEFCAWAYPEDTLSNLRLALRLGDAPQLVVTTTPKPLPALKALLNTHGTICTRATTADNADNLSPSFLNAVTQTYGGTRLGRQELGGELIEDFEGALWTRDMLAACIVSREVKTDESAPNFNPFDTAEFDKVIVAVDPPITSGARSDACGIIIAGLRRGAASQPDTAYILHDGTVRGLAPQSWASRVVEFWDSYDADYVLAEVNQGGEMVSTIINGLNADVVVRSVYASRGKAARAEPVSALYTQGRVFHLCAFPQLEDELASLGAQRAGQGQRSPDRADALVWAISDLLLAPRQNPRIRKL